MTVHRSSAYISKNKNIRPASTLCLPFAAYNREQPEKHWSLDGTMNYPIREGFMTKEKIRESVIAGSWYSDDPQTLKHEIARYLENADISSIEGEVVGLVAPHAGYMYSGGVAAHAYKTLKGRSFDSVIVLAPSHRAYFKGASVYPLGGYRTPLGIVPLDHETIALLLKHSPFIEYIPEADAQEHSLEIQLPFLQVVLRDFRLVPIVMATQSFDFCLKLANILAEVCKGRRVLIVASSDLSHYHSYKEAKQLDQLVIDRVSSFDPQGLSEALRKGECEACGAGPIITMMLTAQKLGADHAKVLHYANSGDITGDTRGVVGYMAAAIYKETGQTKSKHRERSEKVGVDLGLSQEEKETLRHIAYEAIRSRCLGKPFPKIPLTSPKFKEHRGAFVCLHKGKELRGCIGMIEGREPLHQTIRDMAVQAAFADPRFCALQPEELDQIDIEISVLTPLERIQNPSQIEIGKHGIWIRKGAYSGLLLPQVAIEQKWDRNTFLEWTCRKAGLQPDAWKEPDTEIYIFSADVF